MGNVSRRTTLLVTDGRFVGSKVDDAAVHDTRCVPSDDFAILLDHLQPAARAATGSIPRPRTAGSTQIEVLDAHRRAHDVSAGVPGRNRLQHR